MAAGRPEVIEIGGAPEFFCDLFVVQPFGETVRILLLREIEHGEMRTEIAAVVNMPHTGFMRSLAWASNDFLDKLH